MERSNLILKKHTETSNCQSKEVHREREIASVALSAPSQRRDMRNFALLKSHFIFVVLNSNFLLIFGL